MVVRNANEILTGRSTVYVIGFISANLSLNFLVCSAANVSDILWHKDTIFSHTVHLFTYLLTASSRALLDKLTNSQLVNKFPEFYGTRGFITAFTSFRHLSLS